MRDEFPEKVESVEARLRRSQEYQRAVLESMPGAIVVFDRELRICDVNEAIVRASGQVRRELIGAGLDGLIVIPELARISERAFGDPRPDHSTEVALRTPSGFQPVEARISGFEDPEGTPRGILAFFVPEKA